MPVETRLYVVVIGGNRFVVESSHPKKAVLAVVRAIRAQATVRLCSPREAFDLARDGEGVMRLADRETWPRVDDRTIGIAGTELAVGAA